MEQTMSPKPEKIGVLTGSLMFLCSIGIAAGGFGLSQMWYKLDEDWAGHVTLGVSALALLVGSLGLGAGIKNSFSKTG